MPSANTPAIRVPVWKAYLNLAMLKVEGLLDRWRYKLHVDPVMSFFISEPTKQAHNFAAKLYPDDEFYLQARYAWVGSEDARKLFLYGCARQAVNTLARVARCCTCLWRSRRRWRDRMGLRCPWVCIRIEKQ